MTEPFLEDHSTTAENLQPTATPYLADHGPVLHAGSSNQPSTESSDTQETLGSLSTGSEGYPFYVAHALGLPAKKGNRTNAWLKKVGTEAKQLPPPPRTENVTIVFTHIKQMIAGWTYLSDSASALVAYWVLSTWFQDALTVCPCLVLTGPPHEAMVVLRALKDLCLQPRLLAGFKRSDFRHLAGYRTLLLAEPNLGNRDADLLGTLTNWDFMLIEGEYLRCGGSTAVYIGEERAIKRIQHSIYVDVTARRHATPLDPDQSLLKTMNSLGNRLADYRQVNLEKVRCLKLTPCGLSLEVHAVANALGSCLMDAPQLVEELVTLLRPQDQQQIADRSDSIEALVVGAVLTLCHQGKDQIFVKEIAAEVNRVFEERGETTHLSPEKAGRKLRKVGLLTRRLSQAGNGLILDQPTRIHVHELVATYQGEDPMQEDRNLHCPLCQQNEYPREVV